MAADARRDGRTRRPRRRHRAAQATARRRPAARRCPNGRAVLGGLLVAAAAVGTFAAWSGADDPPSTRFVVAARDLARRRGARRRRPRARAPSTPPAAVGRAGLRPTTPTWSSASARSPRCADGELVQRSAVVVPEDADGGRQLSFAIDVADALAGTLEEGERVDLLVTYGGDGDDSATEVVAAGATVARLTERRRTAAAQLVVLLAPAARRHRRPRRSPTRGPAPGGELDPRARPTSGLTWPAERYVVLGLAHARAPWFGEVARWATSAALPVEFVKCVSLEELRARLALGPGLLGGARRRRACPASTATSPTWPAPPGCAVLRRRRRPGAAATGSALGAVGGARRRASAGPTCSTPSPTTPARSAAARRPRGRPCRPAPAAAGRAASSPSPARRGAGASTVAMAAGPGARRRPPPRRPRRCSPTSPSTPTRPCCTTPATSCPALQELVDAHRVGHAVARRRPVAHLRRRRPRLRRCCSACAATATGRPLRPRAVEAALDEPAPRLPGRRRRRRPRPRGRGPVRLGRRRGPQRRSPAPRSPPRRRVVVVGAPGVKGVHALVRVLERPARARRRRRPASCRSSTARRAARGPGPRSPGRSPTLAGEAGRRRPARLTALLPERRRLDDLVRDGRRLPSSLAGPVTAVTTSLLDLDASGGRQAVGTDLGTGAGAGRGRLPRHLVGPRSLSLASRRSAT